VRGAGCIDQEMISAPRVADAGETRPERSILDFPEHLNIPAPAALSQMPGDDRRGSVCQHHCPKQAPRLFPTVAGVGPWSFLGDGGRGVSRLPANAGEGPRKILQRRL